MTVTLDRSQDRFSIREAKMQTRVTELLGIEAPIICGGMMRVGTADLAAAVNRDSPGVLTEVVAVADRMVKTVRKAI